MDLLDFDVRFGQGFLFAPPRPLRPEGASATAGTVAIKPQDTHGTGNPAPVETVAIDPPPRATGNAALARRAVGPN